MKIKALPAGGSSYGVLHIFNVYIEGERIGQFSCKNKDDLAQFKNTLWVSMKILLELNELNMHQIQNLFFSLAHGYELNILSNSYLTGDPRYSRR